MRKEDLEQFRRILEDRLVALYHISHGDTIRESLRLPTADDEGPGDEGDEAARLQHNDIQLSLAENDSVIAQQIELALRRITQGSYGICVDCGLEIERRRLELVPWALRCLEDQEAREFDGRDHSPSL